MMICRPARRIFARGLCMETCQLLYARRMIARGAACFSTRSRGGMVLLYARRMFARGAAFHRASVKLSLFTLGRMRRDFDFAGLTLGHNSRSSGSFALALAATYFSRFRQSQKVSSVCFALSS